MCPRCHYDFSRSNHETLWFLVWESQIIFNQSIITLSLRQTDFLLKCRDDVSKRDGEKCQNERWSFLTAWLLMVYWHMWWINDNVGNIKSKGNGWTSKCGDYKRGAAAEEEAWAFCDSCATFGQKILAHVRACMCFGSETAVCLQ